MPANNKTPSSADRRKSAGSKPGLVTLRVSPESLRKIIDPTAVKEETPSKDSRAASNSVPPEAAAAPTNGEAASDSAPNTPGGSGTPSQAPMGPPTEGPKKKGVKRGNAAANGDLTAKIRGKPGPKKKARLEDGTIDPSGVPRGSTYHKLGPKANQGAINAGLRALDRSGKPCRKWAKGGFKLKSFTGVSWEIPRWSAPPKTKPEDSAADSGSTAESSGNSNKENKEASQAKSDNNSNSAAPEVAEPASMANSVSASSPAPVPIAAAS